LLEEQMIDRPDPRHEGMEAYAEGVARSRCPHAPDTDERRLWLSGWDEARTIHEKIVADND